MKKFACVLMCAAFALCGCSTVSAPPDGYTKEGALDNGAMFGEEAGAQLYNYCPSMFYEDENTMHAYYCSNKDEGNITDYIAYRKGVKVNGEWYWSEKKLVLSPTEGTWDARHTCDPAVIKGEFTYKGENYGYLMAYLGCVTSNNMRNEVGLAVARSPEGEWIKCDSINPIAAYPAEYTQWGYGQPSLVSVDTKDKVMLFYTAGLPTGTCEMAERWDLSDLDSPVKEMGGVVTQRGLYKLNSNMSDHISNADFAYNTATQTFMMVGDTHPWDTTSKPTNVPSASRLASLDAADDGSGATLIDINNKWKYRYEINVSESGYNRNHNCCIIRDEYGRIDSSKGVEIAYSVAELDRPNNSLWTLRIHRIKANIREI